MVMVLLAHTAVTPEGKPVAEPMPVASVVVCVIFVNAVLIQSVGVLDAAPDAMFGTVTELLTELLHVPLL